MAFARDFTPSVTVNNFRNGALDTIVTASARGALDGALSWVWLEAQNDIGDPSWQLPFDNVSTMIEMTWYYMTTHNAAGRYANAAMARRMAIILGAARASMTANYQLGDNDLEDAEVLEVPYSRVVTAAAARARALVLLAQEAGPPAVVLDPEEIAELIWAMAIMGVAGVDAVGQPIRLANAAADGAAVNGFAPGAVPAAAYGVTYHGVIIPPSAVTATTRPGGGGGRAFPALTAVEREVVNRVMLAASATPPLSGVCFLETKHIFTGSAVNKFAGLKRQLGLEGKDAGPIRDWLETFTGDGDDSVNSMLFHAAPHPISRGLMAALAMDDNVRARLLAAGLGSAALRLPYRDGPELRAETWKKLYAAVEIDFKGAALPFNPARIDIAVGFVRMNGSYGDLVGLSAACQPNTDAVRALNLAEPGVGAPPNYAMFRAQTKLAKHRRALDCLETELALAAPNVAFIYGHYKEMVEADGLRETMSKAPSLRSLETQYAGMVSKGHAYYKAVKARNTAAVAAGGMPIVPAHVLGAAVV